MRGHTSRPTPNPHPHPWKSQGHAFARPGREHPLSISSVTVSDCPTRAVFATSYKHTSKLPLPQLPQPSRQDHRVTQGILPRREYSPSSQPAFSSVQPKVSNPNPVSHNLSVRTGSFLPRPTDTTERSYPNPGPLRESSGLLTSLVKALSAAAAATAAAATDKFEITTTAAVALHWQTLCQTTIEATRGAPPEIRRRGGRLPRKAPSRPRAHRQPPADSDFQYLSCATDRVTAQEGWMAAAPSRT
jgi:hypothetical protein